MRETERNRAARRAKASKKPSKHGIAAQASPFDDIAAADNNRPAAIAAPAARHGDRGDADADAWPLPIEAFTIEQFCRVHGISRRHFYDLRREGKAPRLMQVGRSIRISRDAAADWRRECEAAGAAADVPAAEAEAA